MRDGLEKRKFQRLECPLEVTVEIVPAADVPKGLPPLQMKSRNIAKDGICLEARSIEMEGVNMLSGHPLARKHRLSLRIALIPDEHPFEATGEVRWYDIYSDLPESLYRVGVEFTDIKNNGKEQLSRFLKTQESNRGFFQKLFK